jgi:hypothetical protein
VYREDSIKPVAGESLVTFVDRASDQLPEKCPPDASGSGNPERVRRSVIPTQSFLPTSCTFGRKAIEKNVVFLDN